jgi:hypothetical protein
MQKGKGKRSGGGPEPAQVALPQLEGHKLTLITTKKKTSRRSQDRAEEVDLSDVEAPEPRIRPGPHSALGFLSLIPHG